MTAFIEVHRGDEPLVIAMPHTGSDIPAELAGAYRSLWLAAKDTDWWIDHLYGFAAALGATVVRTRISRSVIDCNRDPANVSLYPGQVTTGLCPLESFDGEPLYDGAEPDAVGIARRKTAYFDPYHDALAAEIERLRSSHLHVVLFDAHAIRSNIPRLFDGELPQFNVGTNGGATCDEALAIAVTELCAASGHTHVRDGRFRGGWTTRHYGRPETGVHAIQMELAMRGYMDEPNAPDACNWPTAIHAHPAILSTLEQVLGACLTFAKGKA